MEDLEKRNQMIVFLSSIPENREISNATKKTLIGYENQEEMKTSYMNGFSSDLDIIQNIVKEDPNKKFQNIITIDVFKFALDSDEKYTMDKAKELLIKSFNNMETNFTGTILVMSGNGGKDVSNKGYFCLETDKGDE